MLIRLTSCLAIMPIFGARTVPAPAKILLSLLFGFLLFPIWKLNYVVAPKLNDDLILLVAREVLLGVGMGFLARLMFTGVEMAGQMLGLAMGFNAAELVNPSYNESTSIMEQFQAVLATLLFLAISGHHLLIEALFRSFEIAPLGSLTANPLAFMPIVDVIQEAFVIAVKLSGPMIAVMVFLNIALGVVGRAVPQINVFITSFPINIMGGFFV